MLIESVVFCISIGMWYTIMIVYKLEVLQKCILYVLFCMYNVCTLYNVHVTVAD